MISEKVVAVSGGFDPIHPGHLRLMQEARKLGDRLIVILNNDNWLIQKKGYAFFKEEQRRELLEAYPFVSKAVITKHAQHDLDRSVCLQLQEIKPHIFANGGDRVAGNIPEYELCEKLGITMFFNVGGGKIESSSELIAKAMAAMEYAA